MAPEVVDAVIERANLLKFLSYKNSRYTAKIDVWAVGGILYTLCCGRPPFYDDNMASIMRNITQGHYSFFSPTWDQVSDEVKGFIASMLQLDPKKRPTASQCRENMWLRNDEGISQTNLHVGELLNVYNRARRQTKVPALCAFKSCAHMPVPCVFFSGGVPSQCALGLSMSSRPSSAQIMIDPPRRRL